MTGDAGTTGARGCCEHRGRGLSGRDRSEMRVEVRVKIGVDLRRWDILDRIHVRFRREVHTNEAIGALTGMGFGKHWRRLAP